MILEVALYGKSSVKAVECMHCQQSRRSILEIHLDFGKLQDRLPSSQPCVYQRPFPAVLGRNIEHMDMPTPAVNTEYGMAMALSGICRVTSV